MSDVREPVEGAEGVPGRGAGETGIPPETPPSLEAVLPDTAHLERIRNEWQSGIAIQARNNVVKRVEKCRELIYCALVLLFEPGLSKDEVKQRAVAEQNSGIWTGPFRDCLFRLADHVSNRRFWPEHLLLAEIEALTKQAMAQLSDLQQLFLVHPTDSPTRFENEEVEDTVEEQADEEGG